MSSNKSDGGKGSSPRPFSISQAEYDSRWDAIFGRDNLEDTEQHQEDDGDLDSLDCPRCGGQDTLFRKSTWTYLMCDQCGWREELSGEES